MSQSKNVPIEEFFRYLTSSNKEDFILPYCHWANCPCNGCFFYNLPCQSRKEMLPLMVKRFPSLVLEEE